MAVFEFLTIHQTWADPCKVQDELYLNSQRNFVAPNENDRFLCRQTHRWQKMELEGINWAIYSNGTLVINGPNEENYNDYGSIISGNPNLKLNVEHADGDDLPIPWYLTRPLIIRVEFAAPTQLINASSWFQYCTYLKEFNSTNLDMSKITHTTGMFQRAIHLKELDMSAWNIPSIKYTSFMFHFCNDLEKIDMSGMTMRTLSYARMMFSECPKLSQIICENDWSTALGLDNPNDSSEMFANCTSLPGFDPSIIDITKAKPQPDGYFTLPE